MINSFIGHMDYIVFLLLLTGGCILLIDEKDYRKRKMGKERNASRLLGWTNLVLGGATLVVYWMLG